jgi:hypothetical protein
MAMPSVFRTPLLLALVTMVTGPVSAAALDIALTNDDGWDAPGIHG